MRPTLSLHAALLTILATQPHASLVTVASWNFGWLSNTPVQESLWPTCAALPTGRDEREAAMAKVCEAEHPSDRSARETCMTHHPCRWVPRRAEAYAVLAEIARTIDADVFALQEVEGTPALERVFPGYKVFVAGDDWLQRVGFAVREGRFKSVSFTDFADLARPMDGRRGRGGELTVTDQDGRTVKFLNVHLKSGCFDRPLSRDPQRGSRDADGISRDAFERDGTARSVRPMVESDSCSILARQVPILERWIDGVAATGTPYVLLGDFNRRLDSAVEVQLPAKTDEGRQQTLWKEINDGEPRESTLTRVNERRRVTPACSHGGRYTTMIDHIIVSQSLAPTVLPQTFRQWPVKIEDPELSDHCPISVRLDFSKLVR